MNNSPIEDALEHFENAYQGPLMDGVNRDITKSWDDDYFKKEVYQAYKVLKTYFLQSQIDDL